MVCYGLKICPDCRNFIHLNESRRLGVIFIDISDSTMVMKDFFKLRDNLEIFKDVRANSGIGIPCFVDGERATLDENEALSWLGQPPVTEEELKERAKQ